MEQNTADFVASKDEVVNNFQSLIAGAEDLLRSTANATGEGADVARRKFRTYIDSAKGTVNDIEAMALDRYKAASTSTDAFVHTNPWQAVGIAAAAGALLGFLAKRR